MIIKTLWRADDRTPEQIWDAGGFVPRYLLESHVGGFEGFCNCHNKTPGNMGCNCNNMDSLGLLEKARNKFREVLSRPLTLQSHVMFNQEGFVSVRTNFTDETKAAGHTYKIIINFSFERSVQEAMDYLGIRGHVLPIASTIKILFTPSLSTIAAIPIGGVEMTFLSPIRSIYISHV